jgi:putative flippase GtrA
MRIDLLREFTSRNFFVFVAIGGLAAVTNFVARYFINFYFSYLVSIILAYMVGILTAFILNKFFNFRSFEKKSISQLGYFVFFNILGMIQTAVVSVLFAYSLLPLMGVIWHRFEIAHFIGLGVPVFTSFLGHKYFSFGGFGLRDVTRFGRGFFLNKSGKIAFHRRRRSQPLEGSSLQKNADSVEL